MHIHIFQIVSELSSRIKEFVLSKVDVKLIESKATSTHHIFMFQSRNDTTLNIEQKSSQQLLDYVGFMKKDESQS